MSSAVTVQGLVQRGEGVILVGKREGGRVNNICNLQIQQQSLLADLGVIVSISL